MAEIDITAITKLKHADLWSAAKKAGSQKALAELLGVSNCTLNNWINFRGYPRLDGKGSGSRSPERQAELHQLLSQVTGKTVDDLWPDELKAAIQAKKIAASVERTESIPTAALVSYAEQTTQRLEHEANISPATGAEKQELVDDIEQALKTLTFREREIVKLRLGLPDGYSYTLDEISHIFKVTRERIRQIYLGAIEKLQQPERAALLVQHLIDAEV